MAKNIEGSVGYSGRNMAAHVMTVQYLLNCVPANRGGPGTELAVDGIVGPMTLGAIRRFQTFNFGRADGRVDPNGKTLHALQSFDPYPNQTVQTAGVFKMPMPPAPGSSGQAPGKMGSPSSPFGKQPGWKQPGSGGFGGGKWGG
jgi:peptidoglycan hydrolase-like protein with peptidoglycan-binding domain